MAEKKDTCFNCKQEFPIRSLRYNKMEGIFRYLCLTCRVQLKAEGRLS